MSESKTRSLFQELKRRRVFRVATLYVVSMWPLIQVIDILSPVLNISDSTIRSIVFYFILGFPVAIASAWLYNLTPKGLVKNKEGDTEQNDSILGNRMELGIIIFFATVATLLFMFQDKLVVEDNLEPATSLPLTTAVNDNPQSIAVLPFVPFSDDKQDEFFADGLAEELLNVLAKVQSLRVAARTSSFAYKGSKSSIQQIGRDLGVDVILEGSVRRNDIDNTVRVTAQLIDVRSGSHLWSETYDRKFEDIFRIQDEITTSVVDELKITLLGEEQNIIMAHETASAEAVIAHSQGRSELAKRVANAIYLARDYFKEAIRIDPNYATAYASLAEAEILLISYAGEDKQIQQTSAQAAVDKALSIEENLGLAWAAQGLLYTSITDNKDLSEEQKLETLANAKSSLKKSIELNPSYANAYMWYGSLHEDINDKNEYYQKALQLDPKSTVAGFNLASNYIKQGRDVEAMEVFGQIVDVDPFYPNAYTLVGQISENNGRYDQAILNFEKSYDLGGDYKLAWKIANLYTEIGDLDNARKWLDQVPADNNWIQRRVDWLRIVHKAIEDDWEYVQKALTKISTTEDSDSFDYKMDATLASYYLMDYPKTVKTYEAIAEELSNKKNHHEGSYSVTIVAAFAYNQLEKIKKGASLVNAARVIQKNIDANGFRKESSYWYHRGLLEIVAGNEELGLSNIERAVDQGWIEEWLLKREPIILSVKEQETLAQIRQSMITRIRILREQLAYDQRFTAI